MSSHQPFNTPPSGGAGAPGGAPGQSPAMPRAQANAPVGEVQHIHFLSDHIGALYLNDEYSDVTLVVDGQRFDAHKVILAARSEYFRALLFGGMRESGLDEIELKDTPLAAFKYLLRYIYTGQMSLGSLKDELVLEILGLAHQYGFQDLEAAVSNHLRAVLSIRNVCLIYDTAALYQLRDLVSSCCLFMDRHAAEIIKHDSFLNMSANGVRDVVSRDSFCAPEVEIFRSVHDWVRANPSEERAPILRSVRLSLMATPDLLKVVRPTGLVPPDVMLDAIQSRTESRDMELKYRGYLIPEENVTQPKHGAQVLVGEVKQALLDGDTKNYDMERGFSRHPIDESQPDKGIVIKLGMQCIINNIKMLLWDRDQRAYSYYIDVSMDQQDWARVVDHSKYHCRSWQDLYFTPRVARYIRVVGTHNTVNKVFHVVAFEAYYTRTPFQLDKTGVIAPVENVATISRSACVIEGVCRSRNALLNGDTNNYDWDSGYTCHQLGSGAIIVQLGQPYAIGSMRLLLWDCDDRSYSYYVEVSANQRDWDVVCDRARENCKSWQTITFPKRPVVYIKIVGTHNTANEVFHCVHFECPANVDASDGPALVASVQQQQQQHRAKSPTPSLSSSSSSSSDESISEANPNPLNDDHNVSMSHLGAEAASSVASAGTAPPAAGAEGGACGGASGGGGAAAAAGGNFSFDDGAGSHAPSVASHRSSPASYAGSSSSQIPMGSSAHSLASRRRSQQLSGASASSAHGNSVAGLAQWPSGAAPMYSHHHNAASYPEEVPPLPPLPGHSSTGAGGAGFRSGGGAGGRSVQSAAVSAIGQSPPSSSSSNSSPSRAPTGSVAAAAAASLAYYEEDHFHLPPQPPLLQLRNQEQPQGTVQPMQQQHQSHLLQGLRPSSPPPQQPQQQQQGPSPATGAVARRPDHGRRRHYQRDAGGGGGNSE